MFSEYHEKEWCIETESMSSLFTDVLESEKGISTTGPKGVGKSTALIYVISKRIKMEDTVCIWMTLELMRGEMVGAAKAWKSVIQCLLE